LGQFGQFSRSLIAPGIEPILDCDIGVVAAVAAIRRSVSMGIPPFGSIASLLMHRLLAVN
jgi:hypothetical protein